MLRLFGFLIIITGSCGCGFSVVKERMDYLKRCRDWQELLELMENEIAFRKSSLPEICSRAGGHLSGALGIFLARVGRAFRENQGETLGEVWREEIRKVLREDTLKKEIEDELESLGERLCFEDSEMQRKVLQDMRELLKKHCEEQEKLNREKNKLTLCAGVMGGLFLTILLL